MQLAMAFERCRFCLVWFSFYSFFMLWQKN